MKNFAIIFAILYPKKALIIHREIGKVQENFAKTCKRCFVLKSSRLFYICFATFFTVLVITQYVIFTNASRNLAKLQILFRLGPFLNQIDLISYWARRKL